MKEHLNRNVKFRESFRPYGCTVLQEKTHLYFKVRRNFRAPYMSFAPAVRPGYLPSLRAVTHIDGTSRIQVLDTADSAEEKMFRRLIQEFGRRTGICCVLNTSLNVAGDPLVETPEHAAALLRMTPLDGMVVGGYYIRRKKP